MSDKYTVVETDHGGIGEWDHVEPAEAIALLRVYYEHERNEAVATLADINAGRVRVYHQYGPCSTDEHDAVLGVDVLRNMGYGVEADAIEARLVAAEAALADANAEVAELREHERIFHNSECGA